MQILLLFIGFSILEKKCHLLRTLIDLFAQNAELDIHDLWGIGVNGHNVSAQVVAATKSGCNTPFTQAGS